MAVKLVEIIKEFSKELDQHIASSIFDPTTGQSIADITNDPEFDPSIPAAYLSEVIKENEKGLDAMKSGVTATDYLMTINKVYVLLKAVEGTWYYHGCTIDRSGSLGMAREMMRKYDPMLAEELKKL
jgi:hypothetical protein